jgi:hypothetical protein
MAVSRIQELQVEYDELLDQTSIAVEQYDKSPDGSESKQDALEALAVLNLARTELEARIAREVK